MLQWDIYMMIQKLGELVDFVGVLVMVVGLLLATIYFFKCWYVEKDIRRCYKDYRHNLGRVILLGLEFLVAGDIIRSVAGTPTLMSIAVLGLIVLIRTFLGITFEMEIEGKWPWQKRSD